MYNLLSFLDFNKHPVEIALSESARVRACHSVPVLMQIDSRLPTETKENIKSNYVNCEWRVYGRQIHRKI